MSAKVLEKLQNTDHFVKFRGWEGLLAPEENGAHTLVFRFDPFFYTCFNKLINQYQPLMVHSISYGPDYKPEISDINEDVQEYAAFLYRGGIPAIELRTHVWGPPGFQHSVDMDALKKGKLRRGNTAAEPQELPFSDREPVNSVSIDRTTVGVRVFTNG